MPGIRAVCFDLDGTLLRDDHADSVVRSVARQIAERHPGVDPDELADSNEREWWAYWPEAGADWLAGRIPADYVPREVWRRALAGVGIEDPRTVEEAVMMFARLERQAFALYDDVLAVLAELRTRRIRTALITNGPSETQRSKLEAVGLTDGFDAIIVSGEHGVEKPATAVFRIALDELGVEAREALHVGDNLVADVGGAQAAGLFGVWIDRRGADSGAASPDAVITDLDGVCGLLT